ncbi:MAG: DUF2974 domain-containing protein [Pseudoxanthomonas sp.]
MNLTSHPGSASDGQGFAERFAGRQPQPIDRELSALLLDNYTVADLRRGQAGDAPALPGGWTRMGEQDVRALGIDPALMHDARTGFDASFYRNARGNVVLAYAGSDELQDWKHDFAQGLGLDDAQYRQAIALAKAARTALGNELVLAGHSLGGGLAAAAALAADTPAVTFNAAGVHDGTLERAGLDPHQARAYADAGLVRSYAVDNEILTWLQEERFPLNYAMPDALGHRIALPDPDPLSFFEALVPGRMLAHRLELHGIDAVMQAQDRARLDVRGHAPATAPIASRLLEDAVRGLAPHRQRLGLYEDECFLNTAAGIAAQARSDGLWRIDGVLPSRHGQVVFAVEGTRTDPAQRRSRTEVALASLTPAHDSAAQLREREPPPAPERQQERTRGMAQA